MHLENDFLVYGYYGLPIQLGQFLIWKTEEFLSYFGLQTPFLTFSERATFAICIGIRHMPT